MGVYWTVYQHTGKITQVSEIARGDRGAKRGGKGA